MGGKGEEGLTASKIDRGALDVLRCDHRGLLDWRMWSYIVEGTNGALLSTSQF